MSVRHWIAVALRRLAYWFEPRQNGDITVTLAVDTTEFTIALDEATKRLQRFAAVAATVNKEVSKLQ